MNKEPVQIPNATLDFFKYEKDGLVIYEFDATECQPPEPMVNTMCALQVLNNPNERVVGTFFHEPFPLYQRISTHFEFESKELVDGDFRVIFKKKQ